MTVKRLVMLGEDDKAVADYRIYVGDPDEEPPPDDRGRRTARFLVVDMGEPNEGFPPFIRFETADVPSQPHYLEEVYTQAGLLHRADGEELLRLWRAGDDSRHIACERWRESLYQEARDLESDGPSRPGRPGRSR